MRRLSASTKRLELIAAKTASPLVVGLGDVIEFTDGKKPILCVRLEEEE